MATMTESTALTSHASQNPLREADGRRLRWTEHRAQRREVQVVMDRLNEEIAGRYRQGTASVDELLAAQRTPRPEE